MSGIGERIKARRLELNMTQTDLALKVGYKDKSAIAKIEKGKIDVSQTNVVKFARALNTSAAYLMEWTNEAETLTETERRILEAYRTASPERQMLALYALGLAKIAEKGSD